MRREAAILIKYYICLLPNNYFRMQLRSVMAGNSVTLLLSDNWAQHVLYLQAAFDWGKKRKREQEGDLPFSIRTSEADLLMAGLLGAARAPSSVLIRRSTSGVGGSVWEQLGTSTSITKSSARLAGSLPFLLVLTNGSCVCFMAWLGLAWLGLAWLGSA